MAEAFNPYQQWLDLPRKSVRPNFYELLSLPMGESDAEKIAVAADRALAKVRGVRPGERAKAWAGLIDELNNAKRLLLDPARRAEYDAALKRSSSLKPTPSAKQKPAEVASAPVPPSPAPKADDPRYPPGSVNKGDRAGSASQPNSSNVPAATQPPAPAPFDSAMLPPGAAYAQPVTQANPQQMPAPLAADPMVAAPAGWPGAAPSYTAMSPQPSAPAPYAQPTGYPGQQYPQQPMYAAQPAYPPGAYQQPVYPQANYAPQGYAQPTGYPQQPYGYGQPMGAPVASPPPPPSYDPMAPVAIPVAQPSVPAPMAMPAAYASVASPAVYTSSAVAAPVGSVPMAVAAPATAAAVPMGQAVAAAPVPGVGVRTSSAASVMAANRRREKSMLTLLVGGGITLAIFVIGAALAYPYLMGPGEEEQIAENPSMETPASNPVTPATTPATNPPVGTNTDVPKTNPAGPMTPMANTPPVGPPPMNVPPSVDPTTTLKPPAGTGNPNEGTANPPPSGTTAPAPMPVQPTDPPAKTPTTTNPPGTNPPTPEPTTPNPAPTWTPTPPTTPDPTTTTPTTPTPPTTEPPAPMPEMPAVTREDLLALSKALTTARDAISEHNFEEADKQLKLAEKHAKTPELSAKVDRLWQINDMTRQFREAVVAAIQGLDAGEVFTVGGSTQVAVVETFPDKIIVRIAGQNRTYPVENLPAGLAVALADMKLDTSDPTNRVIKGAYLLSGKDVNPDVLNKAKTWWEEAQLGGVDVSKLMPFLKDDYEFKKELADLAQADKQKESKDEE